MKFWKYLIAVFCIALAIFGLAEATGLLAPVESIIGELSLWRFALALFFLVLTVRSIAKCDVFWSIFFLAVLFMQLEPNIAYLCGVKSGNLISNGTLLLCAALVGFGLKLLLPGRKRKWLFFNRESGVHQDGPGGYHENSLGSRTIYIDCTSFTDRYVENNLGSTVIKFENTDAYIGGGLLRVENNLGSTVIEVPAKWNLDCQFENNLGSVQNHHKGGDGPLLMMIGENNLGSVVIRKS
jgi:predicted membrane protein